MQATFDQEAQILVEFEKKGLSKVSLTPGDVAEKSAKVVEQAMQTIRAMAERVAVTVQDIKTKPQKVEVEFGLKLDAEAGALIAKTSVEASITINITWESSKG